MNKCEAYWKLDEIDKNHGLSLEQREALYMAQELLESEDLLSEALENKELVWVNKNLSND